VVSVGADSPPPPVSAEFESMPAESTDLPPLPVPEEEAPTEEA
jgi:hypothetical protein